MRNAPGKGAWVFRFRGKKSLEKQRYGNYKNGL